MSEKTVSKQKLRLLYIIDILTEKSDEEHPVSANFIIDCLKNDYGIDCERKTIYDSIDCLIEYGYDVIRSSSPRGYFMAYNQFEIAELRLMIDAVQAADFISAKKTKQLLKKFSKFTSEYHYNRISKQVYIDNRHKSSNEKIFYIIDELNTAITAKKQIEISYRRRKIVDGNKAKFEYKKMIINPYAMAWYNDHYYLIGNYDKYDNIINLRIDRIENVDILNKYVKSFELVSQYQGKFDTADYVNRHLSMFTGDIKPVELICNNEIIEQIMDKFGENIKMFVHDENNFTTHIDIAVTDGLVSWIMQYGDKIKIKSPNELKHMVIDKSKEILNLYE